MKSKLVPIISVAFGVISISASLVFLGWQMGKDQIKPQPSSTKPILQESKLAFIPDISDKDHILGDANAQITLVEYSDTSCGYCKKFHPTAQQIVDHYQGKVNWVYRHKLLYVDDAFSQDKAIVSECVADIAGNQSFWGFLDNLFTSNIRDIDDLIEQAQVFDVSAQEIYQCLSQPQYRSRVIGSTTDSVLAGINGTPGNILIDNQTGSRVSVHGAQPLQNFIRIIDRLLQNSDQ